MPDTLPSHADIEKWVELQPKDVLSRLPNNTERREAERLLDIAADLAHESLEKRADRS